MAFEVATGRSRFYLKHNRLNYFTWKEDAVKFAPKVLLLWQQNLLAKEKYFFHPFMKSVYPQRVLRASKSKQKGFTNFSCSFDLWMIWILLAHQGSQSKVRKNRIGSWVNN